MLTLYQVPGPVAHASRAPRCVVVAVHAVPEHYRQPGEAGSDAEETGRAGGDDDHCGGSGEGTMSVLDA